MIVDNGTGVLAVGENYCQAWIDRDAETLTRLMTDDPIVHGRRGVDQVVAFMEALPDDIHTCGFVLKVGNWDAIGTIMTDPDTGAERVMLHVLELDPTDDGKVAQNRIYFD